MTCFHFRPLTRPAVGDPGKPHPRWSQARERDIGTSEERDTLLYNGYAPEVAGLYTGDEF